MLLASIRATERRFSTIIRVDRAYRYIVPCIALVVFATIARNRPLKYIGSSKNGKIISSLELCMVKFVNTLLKSSLVNPLLTGRTLRRQFSGNFPLNFGLVDFDHVYRRY